jgi:hypothetical protein
MRLATYKSVHSSTAGVVNKLIQFRLSSKYSHSEIVFEPRDNVDEYLPDKNSCRDENGTLWCASSTILDKMPEWSVRRKGELGGVRFKRIYLAPDKWDFIDLDQDPVKVIKTMKDNEGYKYDWLLVMNFLVWLVPDSSTRLICSEACAKALGYEEPWRFDPAALHCSELSKKQK